MLCLLVQSVKGRTFQVKKNREVEDGWGGNWAKTFSFFKDEDNILVCYLFIYLFLIL